MSMEPKIYAENSEVQCVRAVQSGREGDPDAAFYLFHRDGTCIGSVFVRTVPGEDGKDISLLTDLNVIKGFQGNHYSDLLHQSALHFIAEETRERQAYIEIRENNGASRTGAERNGFAATGKTVVRFGEELMLYAQSVAERRAAIYRPQYECRKLNGADWQILRDFELKNDDGILGGSLQHKPAEYWESELEDDGLVVFGLFKGNEMAGRTVISFADDTGEPVFTGSQILPEHQGRGLSKLLYDARVRYLLQHTAHHEVTTNIWPGAEMSLKAAEANGFQRIGQKDEDGASYYIYAKTIRPAPAAKADATHPSGPLDNGMNPV
jgi:RimJ/RimL family protein N-acetyltransferase